VDGFTYSETESNPFINYAYLLDLSNGLAPNGLLYQQAFQEVESSGCSTVYGVCTSSYILAYSQQTPFVFKLDFNHPLHSTELDPGSNTCFLFNDVHDLTTGFYGSIDDVRVHPDDDAAPLPPALPLFATGIGGLGLLGWRPEQTKQQTDWKGRREVAESDLWGLVYISMRLANAELRGV
jgi:hypothetical protein